ncbi:MAG: hypothetical protein HF978_00855 [Desulfobacteraceae bacterium]|nr:hypothetical protein [Desulfobacteraceae bacterium]MBC2754080.1 hypothetical protein [Desulfobacteraceae bacterium]
MGNKPKQHDLGDKISKLIQRGIIISDDVMHYINSTFSNPSIEEFRRILADPLNCESDTVFELIFYPELKMQEKLESILKTNSYNEDDLEYTISYLSQKQMLVPVTFPDQRGTLSLHLPDWTLRQFMVRLNITKTIDSRVAETLSRFVLAESDIHRARVMLRNCRTDFSDAVIVFLCTCIEKMYAASAYFWNAFTFLLNFFEYTDPGQDIYFSLMREKKAILHSIDQAEKSEKALKNNSVEALMLKGVNILSINIADARKKIVLIDHICISIFGKTELYG